MTDKPVLLPSPEHPITVEAHPDRVTVAAGDVRIADTTHALALAEADYPVVRYVPREDVDMSVLRRSDHTTYCPYKGDAAYYDVVAGDRVIENAVWTYEAPYDAVADIKDRLAFYTDRLEVTG
ncbi:DUF427 domain-containing protein [Jatrophihabitans sp. YIM 134969]